MIDEFIVRWNIYFLMDPLYPTNMIVSSALGGLILWQIRGLFRRTPKDK